jgi:hypothetical protein
MNVLLRSLLITTIVLFATVSLCSAAEEATSGSLFGFGQGYFHPALSLTTAYSDNYKQVSTNEESDWKTTISPGFWLSVPATQQKVATIVSTNAAAGGQAVSRFQDAEFKGFQGSLMYDADIVRSHDHSDEEDTTDHYGQGMLQYAFAGGLTLEVSDAYVDSTEEYSESIFNEAEEYNSNLLNVIAFYKVSPKLKMRVGYSNFNLEYTSGTNVDFKERTDQTVSAYVFYSILPKTDLFVQYDYIDQDYDQKAQSDNEQNRYYVGLKFDSKARITGHLKLGYSNIDIDRTDDTQDDFIGYASLGYALGSNSQITLTTQQSVDVSDQVAYQNVLHQEVGLSLNQRLSHKLSANVNVAYKEDEYRFTDGSSGREDEDHVFGAGLGYAMNDWLDFGVDYNYTDRDSNRKIDEYKENLVMFTASAKF